MNEAALYALEHIDKTVEIHDAISDMEKLVFERFDTAVKESVSGWLNGDWQYDENYNLMNGRIYLCYRKNTPTIIVALAYGSSGNGKNVWTFLGKNGRPGGEDYSIWLYMPEVPVPQNHKIFEMEKISALTLQGFKKRTEYERHWLRKTISFNSEDILKGLKDERWEDALSPLKKAWQPLVELDWDEIYRIVNET